MKWRRSFSFMRRVVRGRVKKRGKEELERYAQLCSRKKLTEEERAERAELKIKFKNLSTDLSGAAREKFEDIERRRETND